MGRPTHTRALSVWANGQRVGLWSIPAQDGLLTEDASHGCIEALAIGLILVRELVPREARDLGVALFHELAGSVDVIEGWPGQPAVKERGGVVGAEMQQQIRPARIYRGPLG